MRRHYRGTPPAAARTSAGMGGARDFFYRLQSRMTHNECPMEARARHIPSYRRRRAHLRALREPLTAAAEFEGALA